MNQHTAKAIEIYGEEIQQLLAWHLCHGVVISLPDCFLLGFFCNKSSIGECRVLAESDCIFVTMCVGNMRQACMQIVELVPWVAYQREFKGDHRVRITNFKKLFNKL
jgi:hypothetical protein